jgi:hypothetical protein
LEKLSSPPPTHFEITEINSLHNYVRVEDRALGLSFHISFGKKELSDARIVDQYFIEFRYADGSSLTTQFML